jgi:hypothetical protein
MSARLNVSEKTLEINIAAEMLAVIRRWPLCDAAVWIGLTQAQERTHGYDEALANVPLQHFLALQFKAPKARPADQAPYHFAINELQNDNLLRLAQRKPAAVRYVFPLINSVQALHAISPNLLTETVEYPVLHTLGRIGPSGTARKGGGTGSQGTHRVDCWPHRVVVHSEAFEDSASSIKGWLAELTPAESLEGRTALFLTRDELLGWFGELDEQQLRPGSLGQLLRGFRLVGF